MFSLIVAFDKNQTIGLNNKMPWHYPEDLAYFKKITLNHKVVMGSNTFMSVINYLGKPFTNRETLVLSYNELDETYSGVEVFSNLDLLIEKYSDSDEEVFIAGGMSIYEQMIDKCDKLYITHINKEFDGDAFFPKFNYDEFNLVSENVKGDLNFCVYERKNNV